MTMYSTPFHRLYPLFLEYSVKVRLVSLPWLKDRGLVTDVLVVEYLACQTNFVNKSFVT
jgi:hypothetical protein